MPEHNGIEQLKQEIHNLKKELNAKEILLNSLQNKQVELNQETLCSNGLTTEEIIRYSRQIIMKNIQVDGQISLKNAKVLIVGIGGLGCPAALYLASAGVGELTLMDYDEVELSNIHRQILHSQEYIGKLKVESACTTLKSINRNVKIIPLKVHANSTTLSNLVSENKYNVLIDGTDNVATRYLLNDICVMNNIPLVSGSALQMEGQLTVYHFEDGPCYRCLFPIPPPAHTVTNCGDGGVLGAIAGVIGVLEALEAIKVILRSPGVLSGRYLVFDGSTSIFRNVKLRQKNPKCEVCGDDPAITSLIDYEQFCGASAHDKVINVDILSSNQHIDVKDFQNVLNENVVIDVRPELEYKMCKLPNTFNFPYSKIQKDSSEIEAFLNELRKKGVNNVYFICRRGNDSQRAITYLKSEIHTDMNFYNVKGGLHAYSQHVDSSFPVY